VGPLRGNTFFGQIHAVCFFDAAGCAGRARAIALEKQVRSTVGREWMVSRGWGVYGKGRVQEGV
jgi:hypothetical protein